MIKNRDLAFVCGRARLSEAGVTMAGALAHLMVMMKRKTALSKAPLPGGCPGGMVISVTATAAGHFSVLDQAEAVTAHPPDGVITRRRDGDTIRRTPSTNSHRLRSRLKTVTRGGKLIAFWRLPTQL